jgi:hypothetical protein
MTALPAASGSFSVALIAGSAFVAGGVNASGYSPQTYKFDMSNLAGAWVRCQDMPSSLYGNSNMFAASGNNLYLLGGRTESATQTPLMYVYDAARDIWEYDQMWDTPTSVVNAMVTQYQNASGEMRILKFMGGDATLSDLRTVHEMCESIRLGYLPASGYKNVSLSRMVAKGATRGGRNVANAGVLWNRDTDTALAGQISGSTGERIDLVVRAWENTYINMLAVVK